jgi:DEAD/DEAH box helicase domain-containing protein
MIELARRIAEIAETQGFRTVAQHELAAHPASYAPLPHTLHPTVLAALRARYPEGLYTHQACGIQTALEGHDVCLATPTASGKSLVFMALAAHQIKSDPHARVLALYPARALIQDQLDKWREVLADHHVVPGYIDGGVPMKERERTLQERSVVLMTPDVAHAWLMSHLHQKWVRHFLDNIKLLILDETHVYDGVFGTNMAHFLRRLLAVCCIKRIVTSTATIGEPDAFIERLIGRRPIVLGANDDGSPRPVKSLLVARSDGGNAFDRLVQLLRVLSQRHYGKFLVFADSRKMVEQLVGIASRKTGQSDPRSNDDDEEGDEEPENLLGASILPYRAGYEDDDRKEIQRLLRTGRLAGVVSTSAMELGLGVLTLPNLSS